VNGIAALAITEGVERPVGQDFDAVAMAQARRLYGLAFSILSDAGESEDAVQETLVLAWRSWDALRDEGARSAWLTRICVNHCLRRRGLLSRLPWPSAAREEVHPVDRKQHQWPLADGDARRARLGEALDRLSARQRAVLSLHYHYGYSLDESAALIGCRPGTARSHLARGLATLREVLDDARA
jgi:RNA polymerase sigma-70 factor (ECF subfamily)